MEVVKEKPENPLEAFKTISVRISEGTTDPTVYKEIPAIAETSPEFERIQNSIKHTTQLLKNEIDEDEQLQEPVLIPDFISEMSLLEWAGVNLDQEEIYKLSLSVQQLADSQQLEDVRFVGKIFGKSADYIIIEARPSEFPESTEEEDENSKVEPWGTGANEFAYFATTSPESEWTMLPQLRPEWVVVARDTRRYFTGDLNAPVLGFPRFPGNEAAYLRAQLARIIASTWIAPRGMYIPDDNAPEEDDVVRRDDEWQAVPAGEIAAAEHWEHYRAHLLSQGRISPWIDPNVDEDDEPEPEEEVIRKLRPAGEDDHNFGPLARDTDATGSWSVRVQPSVEAAYACACLYSNAWPGAVAVSRDSQLVNIYVGDGLKYLGDTYTPPPPPPIQTEYIVSFNPDEDETDPLLEQQDPEPPKDHQEDEDEDDEIDDVDLEDDDDEYQD
jgi:radial spoke head protein 4A